MVSEYLITNVNTPKKEKRVLNAMITMASGEGENSPVINVFE
jgi:hypothetical protein